MTYTLVVMSKGGDWLRQHRQAAKMSQADVAAKARVSTSYVSTLERGQKHSVTGAELRPEPDKTIRLAKAVEGDPDELLVLYGYAPRAGDVRKRPSSVPEFLEVLESLGIDFGPTLMDRDKLAQYTEDDFEELIERIKADLDFMARRKR